MKLDIYIKITSDDDGSAAWWTFDLRGESYLCDGNDLWAEDRNTGYEYCRGTPCKTVQELKREAKEALKMASFDGMVDPKVSFWKYYGGKLCRVKLTRDGKIVRL